MQIDKLIFNLQTVSKIQKGDRISTTKEFITIDTMSMLQGARRWWVDDSRDKAVIAICREVRMILEISQLLLDNKYLLQSPENYTPSREKIITMIKKIHCALSSAVVGITNLCETYDVDANVLAYLKPLIVEILEGMAAMQVYIY